MLDAPETSAPIQVENVLLGADGQWKCHGNLRFPGGWRFGVSIFHVTKNATDSEMLGKRITGWWFHFF